MPSPPDSILPPVINVGPGGKGAWTQPGSYGRNGSGYYTTYIKEGTRAEVEAYAAIYDAAGYTYEVNTLLGGRARVTASTTADPGGGAEVPESIWEFEPQETQKELSEADFPFASTNTVGTDIAALTQTDRIFLKQDLEDPAFNAVLADAFDNCDSPANVKSMFLLMKAGVRTFPIEAPSIRHTQIVSNVYPAFAAFTNVGRILSRDSMISLEGTGTLFLFNLPTTPTIAQFIETVDDLQYGWRKIMPRITRQTYNKWQIVNVWHFGLWATKLWGAVI